jgi:hypothetical protein
MATRIVFMGSSKDQPLSIIVDNDMKTVGNVTDTARALLQLQKDGEPIWINMANVLYVEEWDSSGPQVHFV